MAKSTTPTPAVFPGAARIRIAAQAARDTSVLLDALDRAGFNTEEHDDLIVALQPRLRALASVGMAALDDEQESVEDLRARYDGWA